MSAPLRLAFVNSTHKWGGVKTWTLELCRWLADHGHEPLIVARPGPFADASLEAGLRTVDMDFGPDLNPLAVFKLARLFRQHGTQLAVVNVGKDLRTAGVAARLLKLPVIMRLGLPGDLRNTRKVRLMHRFLRPTYLVPSRETLAKVQQRLPFISPRDILAIRTGKMPGPKPSDDPHQPVKLITTSQLTPGKGHVDLLDTLVRLTGQGHDFQLEIAGTGNLAEELQAMAHDAGLGERVTFSGFTTNIRARLRTADVFVLPSFIEAMPNALLEAMAEGLAPVARRVGGVDEIWPSGLGGLLAEPKPGSLYAPLLQVLEADAQTLHHYRMAAWEACRTAFNLNVQAAKLVEHFQERIRTEPYRREGPA